MQRFLLFLVVCLAHCSLIVERATAQTYPSRPITLLVPFAAGGGTDIMARVVAEKMSRTLGQQIVVDNRPGAIGTIAMRQVARGTPDGYTLVQANTSTLAIAPNMVANIGYDSRKDFAPVGLVGITPLGVIVHPSVPARSTQELIALVKKDPDKVVFASGGVGGVTHLAGELFANMAGTTFARHVPYKGIAPAINDLLGGHVSLIFGGLPPTIAHVRDGKLRAGYEATQHYGIVAPKGTPRAIIDRLNVALRQALALEDVLAKMAIDGTEPLPGTPEDYVALIDREEHKWSQIIRQAGLKPE
jgi:tripartite-type tricarboxylate transporter receptor subunit TctC